MLVKNHVFRVKTGFLRVLLFQSLRAMKNSTAYIVKIKANQTEAIPKRANGQ